MIFDSKASEILCETHVRCNDLKERDQWKKKTNEDGRRDYSVFFSLKFNFTHR